MPMRETATEIQSTMAAFIGYLRRKNMSDRTISAYTSDVNSFLRHNAGDTGSAKLSSITAIQTKDVEDYLLGLAKSGLNFPSVRRASFALFGKFQQIPFTPTKFASQNLVGAVPTGTYLKHAPC